MRAVSVLLAIGVAAVAACGLSVTGTQPAAGVDGGGPPAPLATGGGDDASADIPPSNDDAGVGGLDAGCDAEAATYSAGTLRMHPAVHPVAVDGDLSEWACAKFFTFDKTSAAEVQGDNTIANSYSFALAYDANKIYVAVRAKDAPPLLGNVTPDVYNNDAIELFFGGDATFDGTFTTSDHQYVVDWKNRTAEYHNTAAAAPGAAFVSAVTTSTTGFVVEASVAASALGRASFASGNKVGWGIAADDSDGSKATTWMNWYKPAVSSCSGCCENYCSTLFYATLSFGP